MKNPVPLNVNRPPHPTSPLEQLSLHVTAPIRRFGVILADPPWRYNHSKCPNRSVERHYPTLTCREIAAMPVQGITTSDSILFLWVTPPKLDEGLKVLRAWGFRYVTGATWDKVHIGPGIHFRQQHEHLLVGKRGRGTPTAHCLPSSIFRVPRSPVHSRKPDEVYEYVERSYPSRHRIELFARRRRPGWHVWGDEVECDVDLPNPAHTQAYQLAFEL